MGGSIKITVEIKCAQCRKKLSLKGKTLHRNRRYGPSSVVHMPDVWTTDWEPGREGDSDYEDSSIQIYKGHNFDGDDDEDLYCSQECVLKFVAGVLPKLKSRHEDE